MVELATNGVIVRLFLTVIFISSCHQVPRSESDALAAKSVTQVQSLRDSKNSQLFSCLPEEGKSTTLYAYQCIDFLVSRTKSQTIRELNLSKHHSCSDSPCEVKKGSFGCKFNSDDSAYILWMKQSSESCPPGLDASGARVWQAKSVRKN